jgi:hypothetical protein
MRAVLLVLVLGCGLAAAKAQSWRVIDLDLRTDTAAVQVGDTVYVDLYAVADNGEGTDEPFSMVTTPLRWDSAVLRLLGVVCETEWPPDGYAEPCDDIDYDWMFTGFPDDSGMGGWNVVFEDGDCDYHAWPNYWNPLPIATSAGTYVTTFIFEAVGVGATTLVIHDEFDLWTVAGAYDDEYGGWNIVDELDDIAIEVMSLLPRERQFGIRHQ